MADVKKVVDLEVKSNIDKVNKDVKDLNKSVEKTGEASQEAKNQLNAISGGKLSALTGILKKVRLGFVSLKTAIISSGIGALALAVLAVGRAFKDSEEGQNKFAKIMGVIGAVLGNITDLLADLGEKIISAFENPQKAVKDFAKLIKDNIVTRFEGLTKLIPRLGKAINLLFKGEFKEAGKVAANAVGQVALGVENVTDKIKGATVALKDFVSEQVKEGNAAAKVADMRAKAVKLERKLLIRRAELENKIAQLRLKSREEDRFGAEERKQALLDAQKLEDELLQRETKVLQLKADAQTLENTFSRSNIENLNTEAELQAAVIRQQATRTNAQRQTQRELNRLNKEIAADNKRIKNEELKDIKDLEAFKKSLEKQNEDERIAKAEKEREDRLLKLESLKTSEEEKNELLLEVEQQYLDRLAEIREEDRLAQEEKDKEAKEKQLEEEAALEEKRKAMKMQTLDTLARLAGEETKIGKALLLAKALIQAQEMIQEAKGTLFTAKQTATKATLKGAEAGADIAGGLAKTSGSAPFPANVPLIAGYAAQAVGILSAVRSAVKTAKGSASVASPSTTASFNTASIPSVDLVGTDTNSVLASAINNQNQQPIQAYVTSTDVSSAQSLERNRIDNAGF